MALKLDDLNGIYRSFSTVEDITAAHIKGDLARSTKGNLSIESDYIKRLLSVLLEKKFLNGEKLWDEFQSLATSSNPNDSKKLSRLIRFYHYSPTGHTFEKTVSDWYKRKEKGGRPSAYGSPGLNGKYSYEYSSLRDMLPNEVVENFKSTITMVLVDSPAIDFKLRNADKVELFTNYIPSVMMSQVVPYLDVKFISKRESTKIDVIVNDPDGTQKNKKLAIVAGFDFLSPINFLEGGKALYTDSINSANNLIRDSYARIISKGEQQQNTTGIEMFTMPQTLVNMDYDQQNNPRYNPVINPTVPFGAIQGVTINVVPSYSVFSFKTAGLTLKIFDRSRLSEIAELLNPILYSNTTVLMTYGWRAPITPPDAAGVQQNKYHSFINGTMLKSETYGIRNSSISIDNSGVVNITLDLFTKGSPEFREISPSSDSQSYDNAKNSLQKSFDEIKELAGRLKIIDNDKKIPDIRGSVLITSAASNDFPQIDENQLIFEFNKLSDSLKNVKNQNLKEVATDLTKKIKELYLTKNASYKAGQHQSALGSERQVRTYYANGKVTGTVFTEKKKVDDAAKKIIRGRFDPIKNNKVDFFSYLPNQDKQVGDDSLVQIKNHPLIDLLKNITQEFEDRKTTSKAYKAEFLDKINTVDVGVDPNNNNIKTENLYGNFGSVSFGKVLLTYISSALSGGQQNIAEEYQLFFYNLNENAGTVANLNIAEFPVDMRALEDAYTRRVIEQRGESMTLSSFLEIIRESQFSDIRSAAFGFSDLYQRKEDGSVVLREKAFGANFNEFDTSYLLNARLANANKGTGEPFVQPTVDFYVESGFEDATLNTDDLLVGFDKVSNEKISGRSTGKKIIKIHIYDKAASPHQLATAILKSQKDGGYVKRVGKYKPGAIRDAVSAAPTVKSGDENIVSVNQAINDAEEQVVYEQVSFRDSNGNSKFELVKREVSKYVPTIIVGAEGSSITNVSYSTNQDSALATIMMLRNKTDSKNPVQPNGAGYGDLPMRVIPGQLTMTMLGCPLVEFMQQFFVDLGTGTSIDNLYNVIGITHSLTPGKFSTELKFGFYDAYGKYEGASAVVNEFSAVLNTISQNLNSNSPPQVPGKQQKA